MKSDEYTRLLLGILTEIDWLRGVQDVTEFSLSLFSSAVVLFLSHFIRLFGILFSTSSGDFRYDLISLRLNILFPFFL